MARKKIREYHSKRLLKEHLKRLASIDLDILSAQVSIICMLSPHFNSIHHLFESSVPDFDSSQVTQSTDFAEFTDHHPWLSSTKVVVKPDMLFGKRGKSGLVALNLDIAEVAEFVKARLGVEVIPPNENSACLLFFFSFSYQRWFRLIVLFSPVTFVSLIWFCCLHFFTVFILLLF